ncbi:interleukin-1 receptor-associated kinase [Holotrichia oblita]|uniref:Interleukin-1 receptor-associated kinase n=2 Tax=Holotrichia oblita TaxID=644536 RepID=A0ACB9SSJ3_HOLOL|nr:interleukin-1 receptor-associated kinase [Holotrichia oblita]KAI4457449.1 interleukin-1 receptor-associated kinase [Holotrichia oblita]
MYFCESGNLIERNHKDTVDHSASCMCRLYSTYVSAPGYISNVLQEALLEESFENLSLNREKSILCVEEGAYPDHHQEVTVTAREVLLRKCGQTEPSPFEKCYPNSVLKHCQKIGEGVYGEVFLFRRPTGGGTSVIKVIPIEGSPIVNGEHQKKFDEILSEITIAMELSDLRTNARNRTSCYSELRKVTCVRGKYPERLVELWELWEESRGSDNDHPEIFDEDQLYIVLELANGGNDMESFVFDNAQQAYALVTQIACALAVGESQLQFEHRDLHWGNILVSNTDDNNNTTTFTLDGKEITLDTYGIQVAIIDFTLSRINLGGDCIYNNLALDPDQFTATGDYQFELYRLMQQQNGNNWQHYEPYTNILWLNYIIDKAIKSVRYRNKTSKVHAKYIRHLKELKSEVLCYKSAKALVIDKFLG